MNHAWEVFASFDNWVVRADVHAVLDELATGRTGCGEIVALVGPSGYGKSVAVSQWAARSKGRVAILDPLAAAAAAAAAAGGSRRSVPRVPQAPVLVIDEAGSVKNLAGVVKACQGTAVVVCQSEEDLAPLAALASPVVCVAMVPWRTYARQSGFILPPPEAQAARPN